MKKKKERNLGMSLVRDTVYTGHYILVERGEKVTGIGRPFHQR